MHARILKINSERHVEIIIIIQNRFPNIDKTSLFSYTSPTTSKKDRPDKLYYSETKKNLKKWSGKQKYKKVS